MRTSFHKGAFFEFLMHSKNYFLSNMATGALAFLSLPVMTRLLSPSDYGVLSVFTGYQGVFVALLTLNCYVALGRYFYEKKDDFKQFFGANLIFILLLLSLAFVFFLLFQNEAARLLGLPANTILFIVPAVLIYIAGSWFEQIYVPQKQSRKIAVRNVIRAYGIFALSIVFILLMDSEKYLGQIYATIIIGGLFFIYYFFDLKSYLKFAFQFKHITYIMHYSVPLLPYALSGVILAQFDRIMINSYLGSTPAGLYAFAAVIGSMLAIVSSSLFQAWNPDYFKHMDEKNYDGLNYDAKRIFRIIVTAALLLIVFSREVGVMLGSKDFYDALPVIPVIVVGYVFNSVFAFYGWNIEYEKKNIYLSLTVLLAGALNIILNVIFIPRFGYFAAAYTTAVSYIAMALFAWCTGKFILKIYCVPLRLLLIPLAIIAPFVTGYYLLSFAELSFWPGLFIKSFLVFAGTGLLWRELLIGTHLPVKR